jgi:hypothetical protein
MVKKGKIKFKSEKDIDCVKWRENVMEILLFVTPLLGVLVFINFVYLMKNTKEEKSTHNQTILGSVLTFFFIFSFMYFIHSLN